MLGALLRNKSVPRVTSTTTRLDHRVLELNELRQLGHFASPRDVCGAKAP